jgi:hypothetical protein
MQDKKIDMPSTLVSRSSLDAELDMWSLALNQPPDNIQDALKMTIIDKSKKICDLEICRLWGVAFRA